MQTKLGDGQTLKGMFASGTFWLEKSSPDINAINVFPVPDGDTGTNMVLTMHSAMEEANSNSDSAAYSVAKSMAQGALMGARGNSGVILSQFWRGVAKGLEGRTQFSGRDLAEAITVGAKTAYEGIVNPVEGTILTVLKDASDGAGKTAVADDTLLAVLEATVKSAEDSVARTPSLLPVLREAGVVDAGGQGVYVLLDGALQYLKGESHKLEYRKPHLVASEVELAPRTVHLTAEPEVPYGYCTNFVLKGSKLNLDKIEKDLKKKGQSLIVTGDDTLARVHIHTFEPGQVLKYATGLGTLHQIDINNMDDQHAEFIKMQRERMPEVDIAMVAVVSGDGFFEIFNSLGNTITVPGGQTMNPSVRELLDAVKSAPSNNVVVLPNNKNIVLSATQLPSLTSKTVKVIPTKTVAQGIAASLAFNYSMDLEHNVRSMEAAIAGVKTIEITRAMRKTQMNGLKIGKGQFIAILDDSDLVASGDEVSDVVLRALQSAGVDGAEIATLYYGADTKPTEAEDLARRIKESFGVEVEVVHGGQPHYCYVISLE